MRPRPAVRSPGASRSPAASCASGRNWPRCGRSAATDPHDASKRSNLDGVDTVVYSTAIPKDHLEIVEARRRGLRVLHRSEALAAAMVGRRAIAVAGTHGKTTTTSMTTVVLQHAGLDPSFVIGGEISEAGSNGHHGTGDSLRGRGRRERPVVPALQAVRLDHHQHRRRSPEHLRRPGRACRPAFEEFCRQTDPAGFVVTCADNEGTRELAAQSCARSGLTVYTYGEAADADLRLTEIATTAAGSALPGHPRRGSRSVRSACRSPGGSSALNSAAALLTAVKLGVDVAYDRRVAGVLPGGAAPVRAQGHCRRRAGLRRVRLPPGVDGRRAGDAARRSPGTGS